jgi:hypothetical protein
MLKIAAKHNRIIRRVNSVYPTRWQKYCIARIDLELVAFALNLIWQKYFGVILQ